MKNIPNTLALNARAAVLIHIESDKVLFAKRANRRMPVASLTKLMTMLLVLDQIDNQTIKWTDMARVSTFAAKTIGSTIKLKPGSIVSIEDLFKGMIINSGNDAAVVLAEHISGNVDQFVNQMNKRSRKLNLQNSLFVNPHGLPVDNRGVPLGPYYSTALDVASMSKEILKRGEVLKYSKLPYTYIQNKTKKLINTNKLIHHYPGLDGLKTGYAPLADYCLAATAKRKAGRILAIVLAEPSEIKRDREVTVMLDHAFRMLP